MNLFYFVLSIIWLAICEANLIDYRSPFYARSNQVNDITTTVSPPEEWKCQRVGLQCKGCSKLVHCLDIGAESLIEVEAAECTGSTSCYEGACTDRPNWSCGDVSKITFTCTSIGMFPNPSNCKEFFICIKGSNGKLTAIKDTCPKNFAYDPLSTYCKFAIKNDVCPLASQVPICDRVGQTGALSNKSIFYICVKLPLPESSSTELVLYPKLYLCANGKSYTNGKCI